MFNSQARQTATGENPVKSSSAPSQVPVMRGQSAAAASSCASDLYEQYTVVGDRFSSLMPPTKEMLAALSAVPSGMLQSMQRSKQRGSKKSKARLAREGQIISRLFDNVAGRPQPNNGISLDQGITLEVSVASQAFITSSATSGLPTYASSYIYTVQFATALTPLLTVFDQYKFEQVEAWIECQAPNGTGSVPELYSAVDLDDANIPTSVGQIQDKQGSIVSGGLAGHYHKWRPHMAVAVYSGAFTSFENAAAGWIDSASPNVQHYGLKVATLSTGGAFAYTLVLRAVISFRGPSVN